MSLKHDEERDEASLRLQHLAKAITSHSTLSFGPVYRLRSKRDFSEVQNAVSAGVGRKLHCRHFLLLVSPSKRGLSRLGITVTLKIDKRATVRNRIKRHIREIFRKLRPNLKEDIDLVAIARNGSSEDNLLQIDQQIQQALKQGGYL